MPDDTHGATLRIVPLDGGGFLVRVTIDGEVISDGRCSSAAAAFSAAAEAGRQVLAYVAEQLSERAADVTLGELLDL